MKRIALFFLLTVSALAQDARPPLTVNRSSGELNRSFVLPSGLTLSLTGTGAIVGTGVYIGANGITTPSIGSVDTTAILIGQTVDELPKLGFFSASAIAQPTSVDGVQALVDLGLLVTPAATTVAHGGTGTTDGKVTFIALALTPSTLTYAGTTTVDFSAATNQTVSLTGNITFASSNLAGGRTKTLRLIGDGSSRTLTFPGGWKFVGAAAPSSLAASKTAILSLTSWSTTDSAVIATYAVEP